VQGVDDRIAQGLFLGITRGKEHEHVAVHRVSFQIAFQSRTVNLDMLDRHWLRTGNRRRDIRLHLRVELS
jgi:hypothetical protein